MAQTVHRKAGLPRKRIGELVADHDDVRRRQAEFLEEPSNAGQVCPIWEFEKEASRKAGRLLEEDLPKDEWIALSPAKCILIEDYDSERTMLIRVPRKAVEVAPPSASAAWVQRNARELIEDHRYRADLRRTRSGLLVVAAAVAAITVVLWRHRRVRKAGS